MKLAFALEYSLGHVTHAQNLKAALARVDGLECRYLDIPYDDTPLPAYLKRLGPVQNNWSIRASLAARVGMRGWRNDTDAAFFNTQVTSLFSAGFMKRVPSIISLDATPVQYDALGAFYGHATGSGKIEDVKKRLNQNAFAAARHIVTWSQWAKDSLVSDYGVVADKITVIPPGIDLDKWTFERSGERTGPVRLLFVGADFPRKGGDTLLEAFQIARTKTQNIALDIVTKSENAGDSVEGVTVHRGIVPNSPELRALFANADVFAFPTRGDCLPLAVMEALASSLPVITTTVGALPEAVTDGETGLVVKLDDADALAAAMIRLATDAPLRTKMSIAAREAAQQRFDATTNYNKLVDLLRTLPARA